MRISDWSSDVCSSDLTGAGCGHQEPQVDPSITLLRRLAITLRDRAIRTVAAQAQDRRRTWLTCWLVEELPQGRLIELKHGERRFGSSNPKGHSCSSRRTSRRNRYAPLQKRRRSCALSAQLCRGLTSCSREEPRPLRWQPC